MESRTVTWSARALRLAAAAWLLGGALAANPAHALTPHFACTLVDGSVRVLTQDLALFFRQSVRGCVPVDDATEEFEPTAAPPAWRPGPSPLLPGLLPPVPAPQYLAALPDDAQGHVHQASARYGLDPQLVSALIYVESRGHAQARSPKGALGLMQIMPGTGKRYGVSKPASLLDPAINVDAGVRYLRDLMSMFPGRLDLTLAAYNAGEGAVIRHGNRIPPYAETQTYVRKILERYRAMSSGAPR
jgi:soluble lytic murein transglycosylase-like protein